MMATKYEWRSVAELSTAVKSLRKAAEGLMSLVDKMQAAGMNEALYDWSEATFEKIDVISALPAILDGMLTAQISAKSRNAENPYEKSKRKSEKDMARRKKNAGQKKIAVKLAIKKTSSASSSAS